LPNARGATLNTSLAKATLVGALGGLLFGFDTAVIAGTTHSLTLVYGLSPRSLGLTVAMALIGTIIGAMSAGIPGQKWGGRETLRILAIFYVISALGCAFAWNWYVLLAARFIGGLGIGGSSVLGPVYIAELAPAKMRGRLVGLFQINIVIGILLAYFSNYCIARMGLGSVEWRWQFGVAAVPAILFLVLLFGIPPSSRWLVTQSRVEEARSVLHLMGAEDPENELREIVDSIHLERLETSEPLFTRKYRLPIFLAISIGMFNQLSGINAILYYLNDIFAAAGFSKLSSELQSVAIGGTNLAATLLAMTVIDKLGRRTFLLIGSVGTALCLAGVAGVFFTQSHQSYLLWLLVAYIAFFAISQGAVIWVYIGEVFRTVCAPRGKLSAALRTGS
jgi:MFS transporter, SP family, arabinose:H+ symporter